VVLRAAEGLDALAGLRARLVDVAGDRRRANERHGRNVRVLEDPVDRDLVAVDDVEHAGRNARLGQELGEVERGRRILLGRLQDERVAARDRVREHPHRDHRREVERRDAGHDAERLADLVDVDAGGHLLRVAALHQVRHAGRELQVLEAAGDLAERVRRDLAVLRGQVRRDLAPMRLDQVPDPEHDLGPLRQRRRAPAWEGGLCGGHRGVDLLDRGEVDLARDRAGRRVEHVAAAPGGTRHAPTVDPVRHDRARRGGTLRHRLCDLGHRRVLGCWATGVRDTIARVT
jgi:hypothetical protein